MPLPNRPMLADELDAMPDDGNRYEVIDGELFVTPAPVVRHQWVLSRLMALMIPYAERHQLAVLQSPVDVRASSTSQVEPDAFAMRREDIALGGRRWVAMPRLLLAVEVLSPSTARTDRTKKRDLYLREGVPEYWIINANAREVEVWYPGASVAELRHDLLTWHPIAERDPLVIDLGMFFDDVHECP